ncbi:MAG: hypothetical protein HQM10_11520 [Candidatus Riflebacteria bacterium]|nr:hypothetical protein [Candidatus Riflebacteria bacterium]
MAIPGSPQQQAAVQQQITNAGITVPKCFGTDYFAKWNTTGMTYESMKIDKPEQQQKCAMCPLFERCGIVNEIKIARIKR